MILIILHFAYFARLGRQSFGSLGSDLKTQYISLILLARLDAYADASRVYRPRNGPTVSFGI